MNRSPIVAKDVGQNVDSKIEQIKENGFVQLDHLVGSKAISNVQKTLTKLIESDYCYEYPCLAQSKIDKNKHSDLIAKQFLVNPSVLKNHNLTFEHKDVKSYHQMITDFEPSNLKIPIVSDSSFYNLWLDPTVMAIVEGYMGFVPEMTEAYIRRNFPAKYPVMNHNWHRDTNHPDYLVKAFIFFTDCDINTGAHHYISGSIQDYRFRDKSYYADSEIHNVWPIGSDQHKISSVPAGTIIIEDTRGLHKAGIPKRDFRDLGFAIFTPPNRFSMRRSYYKISKSNFDELNDHQKCYIPKSNIEKVQA
jgi:hypothetical protein